MMKKMLFISISMKSGGCTFFLLLTSCLFRAFVLTESTAITEKKRIIVEGQLNRLNSGGMIKDRR